MINIETLPLMFMLNSEKEKTNKMKSIQSIFCTLPNLQKKGLCIKKKTLIHCKIYYFSA